MGVNSGRSTARERKQVAGTLLWWLFLLAGSSYTVVKDLKVAGNNTKKDMVAGRTKRKRKIRKRRIGFGI